MASLFFRLIAASLAVSCGRSETTDRTRPVQITPVAETFPVRNESGKVTMDITIRMENTSTHRILWSACGLAVERSQYVMALDRRTEEWLEVWRPACPDTGDAQKTLTPGARVDVPVRVVSGKEAEFHGEIGVYRVRFFLSADIQGEYHQLDPDLSVSRSFAVVDQ